jgi:hypothetical protein
MNFSFLEPLGFHSASIVVTPIPCELDDSWKKFEKELGGFKTQYAKARAAVTILQSRLMSKKNDINVIEIAAKVLNSDELKTMIATVVKDYEVAEDVGKLTTEYAEALGRADAIKSILMDTTAERYARFTCFVCMEALVDTLLVPCNHVICERCWVRTRSSACPGCRQEVIEIRRIFTLS